MLYELRDLVTNTKWQDQVTTKTEHPQTARALELKPNSHGEREWRKGRQLIYKMCNSYKIEIRNSFMANECITSAVTHIQGI